MEIIGRLEQVPTRICCGMSTSTMVKGARAPCSYAPFRLVVEEARAEGLPTRGFAREPEPAELPPDWAAMLP